MKRLCGDAVIFFSETLNEKMIHMTVDEMPAVWKLSPPFFHTNSTSTSSQPIIGAEVVDHMYQVHDVTLDFDL